MASASCSTPTPPRLTSRRSTVSTSCGTAKRPKRHSVVVSLADPSPARESWRMTSHSFEAIHKIRDCGGYPAADGRAMRRRRLYRSAHYPQATEAERAHGGEIGLG